MSGRLTSSVSYLGENQNQLLYKCYCFIHNISGVPKQNVYNMCILQVICNYYTNDDEQWAL